MYLYLYLYLYLIITFKDFKKINSHKYHDSLDIAMFITDVPSEVEEAYQNIE